MTQDAKKYRQAFAGASKKPNSVNSSEHAVAAFLSIWASPERNKLWFDETLNGLMSTLEETREVIEDWVNEIPEMTHIAREAIKVDMDKSLETDMAFSIFSATVNKRKPAHLYVYAHRGQAIVAGPEKISKSLQEKLKLAGIEYVSQDDKLACISGINSFLINAVRENIRRGLRVGNTTETLMYAFGSVEDFSDKHTFMKGDHLYIREGTSVGDVISEAGKPTHVMYSMKLKTASPAAANTQRTAP